MHRAIVASNTHNAISQHRRNSTCLTSTIFNITRILCQGNSKLCILAFGAQQTILS